MSQQQQAPRPRDVMPETWRKITEHTKAWGKEHVAECIRRGMAGEPDWFYAFEGGHVVGTPFKADRCVEGLLQLAVATGGRFALVMRPPAGATATPATLPASTTGGK